MNVDRVIHPDLVDLLRKEAEIGTITARVSGDGNYVIYNYKESVQFDKLWNDVNKLARGIIVDIHTGKIIARPFPKFHNLGENPDDDKIAMRLSHPMIMDKLDGSLGIIFTDYYDGNQLRVSTRGSLDSEQAVWATSFIRNIDPFISRGIEMFIRAGLTPLVEIIKPDNRIVVDYSGRQDLILIGLVRLSDGFILSPETVIRFADYIGMSRATNYTDSGLEKILEDKKNINSNREGWVVSWRDWNHPLGMRMLKIKGDEYIRVHRLISNLTPKNILDMLHNGDDVDSVIATLPDELHQEFRRIVDDVRSRYSKITSEFDDLVRFNSEFPSRKDAALWAQTNLPKDYMPLFFSRIDGRDSVFSDTVWKIVERSL